MTTNPNVEPQNSDDGLGTAPGDSAIDNDVPADATEREKRYRLRLRQTEEQAAAARQQNVELNARLEAVQRSQVEQLAGSKLHEASDVWREGADLVDFVAGDGTVDADKVSGHINELLANRQHLEKRQPSNVTAFPASSVVGDGKVGEGAHPARDMGAFLRDAQRGGYTGSV